MSYVETFSDVGSKIMQKEFKPIKRIYADMEFFQDLRFGALLTHVSSPKELEYVYSQLNVYNKRYDENTSRYFPRMNISDTVLDSDLNDPAKFKAIATVSPMTSMFYNFNTLISMYVRSNKYTIEGDDRIHIVISVGYQNYPNELLATFKKSMELQFPNKLDISFIKRSSRYSSNIDFFTSMDVLFLYDFESFVNKSQEMAMAFASDGLFSEKHIFAKPQINDKFSHLSDKEKEQGVDKMRDQLNLYCDFEYAPSEIIIFNDQPEKGGN